ncbi:MAG: hypothetical protein AAF791_14320, partial [Bacteroidota bacterium]
MSRSHPFRMEFRLRRNDGLKVRECAIALPPRHTPDAPPRTRSYPPSTPPRCLPVPTEADLPVS